MKTCPVCDTGYPDQHATCPTDGAVLIVSHELAAGSLVRGKYRIARKLGQGGMGVVYLAEHILLGGQVALKFLTTDLGKDPKFIKRFRQEARAAYKLRHPNVVEVTDLDQAEDGSLFIAMEYVEGPSLRAVLDQAPSGLEIPRALDLFRGISAGLGAAHAQGIVHRDVKPENILMATTREGREQPKVLYFGIAAMTAESIAGQSITHGIMLTPNYASPEQWEEMPAAEMDGRTDLYALGCVFYEMLTGQTPFHAHNTSGWMKQHLMETPRRPSDLRPELAGWPEVDGLTMRLLAKNRDDRPKDAELARLLDGIQPPSEETRSEIPANPAWSKPQTVFERPAPASVAEEARQTARTPTQVIQPPARPISQPSAAYASQPQATQYSQPPVQHYTQPPAQYNSQPPVQEFHPAHPPAHKKISEWVWGALAAVVLAVIGGVVNFYAPQFLPSFGRSSTQQPAQQTAQTQSTQMPSQNASYTQSANNGLSRGSTPADSGVPAQQPITPVQPAQVNPQPQPQPPQPQPQPPQGPSAAEINAQALALYSQKHYAEAVPLLDKACQNGSGDACKDLGNIERWGNGVPEDDARAATLYTMACNDGIARSCADLGYLYANGKGVGKDDAQAAAYYTRACNAGDAMGCSNLGNIYAGGRGVTKDVAQAANLYTKACEGGDAAGCSNLGNFYYYGLGVEKDQSKAMQFLGMGCKMGNQWGCDRMKTLQ